MPKIIKYYVNIIDYISEKTGRATMYLVFVMMFILILSFVTRNIINIPLIWIIEMAQFVMTGYYLLGGGYSMLTDDHVRMDLIYSYGCSTFVGRWRSRNAIYCCVEII